MVPTHIANILRPEITIWFLLGQLMFIAVSSDNETVLYGAHEEVLKFLKV